MVTVQLIFFALLRHIFPFARSVLCRWSRSNDGRGTECCSDVSHSSMAWPTYRQRESAMSNVGCHLTGESAPPISGCELIFGKEQKRLRAQHLMRTSASIFKRFQTCAQHMLGTASVFSAAFFIIIIQTVPLQLLYWRLNVESTYFFYFFQRRPWIFQKKNEFCWQCPLSSLDDSVAFIPVV